MKILLLLLCGMSGIICAMDNNVREIEPLRLMALRVFFQNQNIYTKKDNCITKDVILEHYQDLGTDMQVEYYELLNSREQDRFKEKKMYATRRESDSDSKSFKGIVARNVEQHDFFSKFNQRQESAITVQLFKHCCVKK